MPCARQLYRQVSEFSENLSESYRQMSPVYDIPANNSTSYLLELLLLRILRFQTNFDHPHKYLLHYLKSLRDWISADVWNKYPIARTSWSLIQDAYHDSNLVLNTDHELLSISCIQLALQTYGIKVPFMSDTSDDEKAWYKVFSSNATKDKLWFVMKQLMDLYNQECIYITPIIRKVSS